MERREETSVEKHEHEFIYIKENERYVCVKCGLKLPDLELLEKVAERELREQLIDTILEVAMAHHNDCSASDVANASDAGDKIIDLCNAHLVNKIRGIEKIVENIISDVVRIVDGGGAFARKITTKQVIDKHVQALTNYLTKEE